MSEILFDNIGGRCARITLNRPAARNALSVTMRRQIARALADADADPDISALVITGAGLEAFCASLDRKELAADPSLIEAVFSNDPELNTAVAIDAFSKPLIAAVNGLCISGGLEIALACDMIVASDNARFADFHVRVGHLPAWGLSQRLARIVGPGRAREMSLTGEFIDAPTAERWGLINRTVAPEHLSETATRLAQMIAEHKLPILKATKRLMRDGFALPLGSALDLEMQASPRYLAEGNWP